MNTPSTTQPVIQLEGIWERYKVKFVENGKVSIEDKWALQDLSFSINKGECVAVLGENGSGKSTLLRVLASILQPDRGSLAVNGNVNAILSLAAGFNLEMPGRDNVYLKASLMGLSQQDITQRFDSIASFASLGRYLYAPMKYYSDGMLVRLGFSVAVHADPDILLVDDCFAVGDIYFQRKCVEKMLQMKSSGKTIIFVSHDLATASYFCERALLLVNGQLMDDGPTSRVASHYLEYVGDKDGIARIERDGLAIIFNHGKIFANYNNIPLLKGLGSWGTVYLKERWFHSYDAIWKVDTVSPHGLSATGKAINASFSYVIKVAILEDHRIDIEFSISNEDPAFLFDRICLRSMVSEDYRYWATEQDQAPFKDHFFMGNDWLNIPLKDPMTSFALFSASDENCDIPHLLFDFANKETNQVFTLDNSGTDFKTHILTQQCLYQDTPVHSITSRLALLPGTQAREELIASQRNKQLSLGKLKNEDLFLSFDRGVCHIWIKNKQITAAQGITTAITYRGTSISSKDFTWHVQTTSDCISCYGTYQDVSQEWHIGIKKGTVSFEKRASHPLEEASAQIHLAGKSLQFIEHDTDSERATTSSHCLLAMAQDSNTPCLIYSAPSCEQEMVKEKQMVDNSQLVKITRLQQNEMHLRYHVYHNQDCIREIAAGHTCVAEPKIAAKDPKLHPVTFQSSKNQDIDSKNPTLIPRRVHGLEYNLLFEQNAFLITLHTTSGVMENLRLMGDKPGDQSLVGTDRAVDTHGATLPISFSLRSISPWSYLWTLSWENMDLASLKSIEITLLLDRLFAFWHTETLTGPGYPITVEDEQWYDYLRFYAGFKNVRALELDFQSGPGVFFSMPENALGWLSFFNSDRLLNKHALRWNLSLPTLDDTSSTSGIIYTGRHARHTRIDYIKKNTVQRERLRLCAGDGRLRLFWNEQLVTKGFHLYCSFRYGDRWYDSYQFFWRNTKCDPNHLTLQATPIDFPASDGIPLTVTMDFQIHDSSTIEWKMHLTALEQVTIDAYQCNVMLHEEYDFWCGEGQDKGPFGSFAYDDPSDTWETKATFPHTTPIATWSNNPSLPRISWQFNQGWPEIQGKCINSDMVYKGRVLQFCKGQKTLQKGDRQLFMQSMIGIVETVC